jgi:hypothetical protein
MSLVVWLNVDTARVVQDIITMIRVKVEVHEMNLV